MFKASTFLGEFFKEIINKKRKEKTNPKNKNSLF